MKDQREWNCLFEVMAQRAALMGPDMVRYWRYHQDRFVFQCNLVARLIEPELEAGKRVRLLDIGPSFQTMMFEHLWRERVVIDTFGFADPKFPAPSRHVSFNLNDAPDELKWPKIEPYDILTMFEVLEHLYTAPVQIFRLLGSLTKKGSFIVLSTPNALAINKRLNLLLGKHPYEQIRQDRTDPGHFRESTMQELREFGAEAGFTIREDHAVNLSTTGSWLSQLYRAVAIALPPGFRKELNVVYEVGERDRSSL